MRRLFILLFLFIAFGGSLQAQSKPQKIHIQEVGIKDSIDHHIRYFIDSVSKEDEKFRNGLGYLWLIIHESKGAYVKDSVAIRHYELRRTTLDYDRDDRSFPLFYTVFEGRPIIIETNDVSSPDQFMDYCISRKSKRKFRKLIEPFLTPREKVPDVIRKQGKRPNGRRWWRASVINLCHCYYKITVFDEGPSKAKFMLEDL